MRKELERLAATGRNAVDVNDADVPSVADWDGFVRGKFYRPIKEPVTMRIDADVLAWFKALGGKYQTRINQVLRVYMLHGPR
jgi:uncharacterized protein (DUF4415 family)